MMLIRTNTDKAGNYYTLKIDHDTKTFTAGYNERMFYDVEIRTTKRSLKAIKAALLNDGFEEIVK